MKRHWITVFFFMTIGMVCFGLLKAAEGPHVEPKNLQVYNKFIQQKQEAARQVPSYASGEMLIKFKGTSPLSEAVQDLFEREQDFQSLTQSAYLDQLNKKYQLKAVTELYKGKLSFEEIKKKFPERSKRIPKGVKAPNLGDTYKFEFDDKKTSIRKICEEYAKDPNVEYAEPNFTATIQNELPLP